MENEEVLQLYESIKDLEKFIHHELGDEIDIKSVIKKAKLDIYRARLGYKKDWHGHWSIDPSNINSIVFQSINEQTEELIKQQLKVELNPDKIRQLFTKHMKEQLDKFTEEAVVSQIRKNISKTVDETLSDYFNQEMNKLIIQYKEEIDERVHQVSRQVKEKLKQLDNIL